MPKIVLQKTFDINSPTISVKENDTQSIIMCGISLYYITMQDLLQHSMVFVLRDTNSGAIIQNVTRSFQSLNSDIFPVDIFNYVHFGNTTLVNLLPFQIPKGYSNYIYDLDLTALFNRHTRAMASLRYIQC